MKLIAQTATSRWYRKPKPIDNVIMVAAGQGGLYMITDVTNLPVCTNDRWQIGMPPESAYINA